MMIFVSLLRDVLALFSCHVIQACPAPLQYGADVGLGAAGVEFEVWLEGVMTGP